MLSRATLNLYFTHSFQYNLKTKCVSNAGLDTKVAEMEKQNRTKLTHASGTRNLLPSWGEMWAGSGRTMWP